MQNEPIPSDPLPQPTDPQETRSAFARTLGDAALSIALGLGPIVAIAILIGLFSNGTAFKADAGYFSGLANVISLAYMVPVFVVFGIIALTLKDWLILFYPIAVWMLGEDAANHNLFRWVGNSLPVETRPENMAYLAAVVFWYTFVCIVGRCLYHILKTRKSDASNVPQRKAMAYVLVMAVGFIGMLSLLYTGNFLYDAQLRDRAAIHIPSTTSFIGGAPTEVNKSFQTYTIVYTDATQQKDGIYQMTNGVSVEPLKWWWQDDTNQVCGDAVRPAWHPGQSVKNEYNTTPGGVRFAHSTFSSNTSNPPKPENAYNVTYYCWVQGNQKYSMEINDRQGLAYLEKYPVEQTIDAIASAPVYMPNCWVYGIAMGGFKKATYCIESDGQAIERLDTAAKSRYKIKRETVVAAAKKAEEAANAKPTNFTEQARLQVMGWGVSFPLSAEIKDAYVVASESNANDMLVGLASYKSDTCFAGVRYDASGRRVGGRGIALLMRRSTAELEKLPAFRTNTPSQQGWVTIGQYSYSLGANSNALLCQELPDSTKKVIYNIFEWAEKGIR